MTGLLWLLIVLFLILDVILLPPMIARARRLPMDETARADAPGRFATLTKGVTHYQWFGPQSGEIVVLVHGLSAPSFIFAPLIPFLTEAGYRVLTYDHYGRGWSDRPRNRQTPHFFAAHLNEILDDQMIRKPVHLLGYSMGGTVVPAFALEHPARVKSMILLAAAGFQHPRKGVMGFVTRTPLAGDWIMSVLGGARLRNLARLEEGRNHNIPDLPQRMVRETRYRGYTRSVLSSMRHILSTPFGPLHQKLAARKIPTLAIWAREDETIPLASADRLREANPDVRTVILDDADHGLAYMIPERVAEPTLAFLAERT